MTSCLDLSSIAMSWPLMDELVSCQLHMWSTSLLGFAGAHTDLHAVHPRHDKAEYPH